MISAVYLYLSQFAFLIILLIICTVSTFRKQRSRDTILIKFFLSIIVLLVMYSAFPFIKSESFAMLALAVGLILINIFRYYTLILTMSITNYKVKNKNFLPFIRGITLVDSLLILSNIPTRFLFICKKVSFRDIEMYKIVPLPSYIIHTIFVYFTLGIAVYALIRKILNLTTRYSWKYVALLCNLLFSVIVNLFCRFLEVKIDLSVVAYAISSFIMYFMLLESRASLLTDKMLSYIILSSKEPMAFFNNSNICVYLNQKAREFFDVKEDDYSSVGPKLDELLVASGFNRQNDEYSALCSINKDGKIKHLELTFKKVYRRNKLLGSYYQIKDRTTEIEVFNQDKYKATHDKLTGLYNADYFCNRAEEILKNDPYGRYYIVCSDIKDFKIINDTFGKNIGDDMLNLIATKIKEKARNILCCRYNGDRFCLLLTQEQFNEDNLLNDVKDISMVNGINYPVLVHLGVYKIENRNLSISSMISRAFMTISENKNNYQSRIFYYNEDIKKAKYWEQKISGELEDAIADNQLKVFLQPQCDSEGKVYGAEALIRWQHPVEGFLSPIRFIQLFEQNGLISKLDLFVWESVAKLLKRWKDEGKDYYYVSVNISPADFYFLDVAGEFKKLIKKYEIDPKKLKLEITESVMMNDIDKKLEIIESLREFGFVVEMDDFGSGYSSLNMLKDMSFDALKLDMGFLYKTKNEEKSRKIIKMVVALSKSLNMPVICEGVENEEQLNFLKGLQCEYYQGYYFSKPITIEEFEMRNMA